MLTRRDLLRLGLLGGAATALPLQRIVGALAADHAGGSNAFGGVSSGSPYTPPFQVALPIPPVLQPTSVDDTTDYYDVIMRPALAQILPGRPTVIWGYNGLYPGPTIRARQGRRVVVRQTNGLPEDTAVHLHGGRVAPEHDGYPLDLIRPWGTREYVYPNDQPGLAMWYHDHAIHLTAPHIYRGLAGFYLLEGNDEARLRLPSGAYDVPLMIQDRLFNTDGSLSYPADVHGVLGDTILVNGAPWPRFEVARRRYRLRFLNASNHREYQLRLDPPLTMLQVATDGGLMPAPVARSTIRLAPAERVEVVVGFAALPVGSQVVVRNDLGAGPTAQVMRFDVVRDEPDGSRVPVSLRAEETFGAPVATRSFDLHFDQLRQIWLINTQGFDPAHDDARPRLDSTEIWEFANRSPLMHPMHLHLVQFKVLDRNGAPPPDYEVGRKDTVAVQPFEKVRILVRFTGYTGRYVFHCHRLEHEDMDMMSQFNVIA